jgi:hypothetical protein
MHEQLTRACGSDAAASSLVELRAEETELADELALLERLIDSLASSLDTTRRRWGNAA